MIEYLEEALVTKMLEISLNQKEDHKRLYLEDLGARQTPDTIMFKQEDQKKLQHCFYQIKVVVTVIVELNEAYSNFMSKYCSIELDQYKALTQVVITMYDSFANSTMTYNFSSITQVFQLFFAFHSDAL